MKIVCVDSGDIFIMPDTVVFGVGEPFFAPDFAVQIEAVAGVVIKITRMTKCLDAKFAYRTWDVAAQCVDYRIKNHASVTISRSFDRSFQLTSEWQNKSELDIALVEKMDALVEKVSNFITLRVGDYIFLQNG